MQISIRDFDIKKITSGLDLQNITYDGERVIIYDIDSQKHVLFSKNKNTVKLIRAQSAKFFFIEVPVSSGFYFLCEWNIRDVIDDFYRSGMSFILGGEFTNSAKKEILRNGGEPERFASMAAMAVCEVIFKRYSERYEEALIVLSRLSEKFYSLIYNEDSNYINSYKYFASPKAVLTQKDIVLQGDGYAVYVTTSDDIPEGDILINSFETIEGLVTACKLMGLKEKDIAALLSSVDNKYIDKYYITTINRDDFKKYLYEKEINSNKYFYRFFKNLLKDVPIGFVRISEIVYVLEIILRNFSDYLKEPKYNSFYTLFQRERDDILASLEEKLEFEFLERPGMRSELSEIYKVTGTKKSTNKDLFILEKIFDFIIELPEEAKTRVFDLFYNFAKNTIEQLKLIKDKSSEEGRDITNYAKDVENFAKYILSFIDYHKRINSDKDYRKIIYSDFLDMFNYQTKNYVNSGLFHNYVDEYLYKDVNIFLLDFLYFVMGSDPKNPRMQLSAFFDKIKNRLNIDNYFSQYTYDYQFAYLLSLEPALFFIAMLYSFLSFAKKAAWEDLTVTRKVKYSTFSKRTTVKMAVTMSDIDSMLLKTLNIIQDKSLNGPSFVLAVLLYICWLFRTKEWAASYNLGKKKNIVLNILGEVIKLDKEWLSEIYENFYKYFVFYAKNLENVLELDGWFSQNNTVYLAISGYYNFLIGAKELINNLYPYQESAIDRIYKAYLNNLDGHLLIAPPGSGKTPIYIKAIERIITEEKDKKDLKVLFLGDNNTINNLLENSLYFMDNFVAITPIRDYEDIEKVINNTEHQYYALSYTNLVNYLSGKLSEARKYKRAKKMLIDSENSPEIKGIDKFNVSRYEKIVEFLDKFDIIVLDDAHYLKSLYVKYNSKKDKVVKIKTNLENLLYQDNYVVVNESFNSIISLFIFSYYLYLLKTQKRKFFILSSSVLVGSWPEDSWLPFYMTGAHKDYELILEDNISFLRRDPIEFAKTWFGTTGLSLIKKYENVMQNIVSNVKQIDISSEVPAYNKILEYFLDVYESEYDSKKYRIKKKLEVFSSFLEKMKNKYYITIYTDRDLYEQGVLIKPDRKAYFIDLNESIGDIIKKNYEGDSTFFDGIKNNLTQSMEDIKEILKNYLHNAYQEGKRVEDFISSIDLMSIVPESTIENVENMVKKLGEYMHGRLHYRTSEFYEEFFQNALLNYVLYGKEYRYAGELLPVKSMGRRVSYKINELIIPKAPYVDENDLTKTLYNFIDYMDKQIDILDNNLQKIKRFYAINRFPFFINYLLYDILLHWIKIESKSQIGSGKVIINSSFTYESWLCYLALVEFMYNIFAGDKEIDFKELIKKITEKTLKRTLAMGAIVNQANKIIGEELVIKLITNIYEEMFSSVSKITETIDIDKKQDGEGFMFEDENIRTVYLELLKLHVLNRVLTFYHYLSAVVGGNIREVENEIVAFEFQKMNRDYNTDVNAAMSDKIKLLDFVKITSSEANYLEYFTKYTQFIKKEHIQAKDIIDYLLKAGYITDLIASELNDYTLRLSNKFYSDSDEQEQDNDEVQTAASNLERSSYAYDQMKRMGIKNFKFSENFRRSKELLILIGTGYKSIDGLDLSSADILYILDLATSCSYLWEIEGAVTRINANKQIKIRYLITKLYEDEKNLCRMGAREILARAFYGVGKDIFYDIMQYEKMDISQIADAIKDKNVIDQLQKQYETNPNKPRIIVREEENKLYVKTLNNTDKILDALKYIQK